MYKAFEHVHNISPAPPSPSRILIEQNLNYFTFKKSISRYRDNSQISSEITGKSYNAIHCVTKICKNYLITI